MREHFTCRWPLGRVKGEERGKKLCTGVGEEGKLGADDRTGSFGIGRETERFGVGKSFEVGPGRLGRDATKFEDL